MDSRQTIGVVVGARYEDLAGLGDGGFSASGKLGAKLDDKADGLEALPSLHGLNLDLGELIPLFAPPLSLAMPERWAPLKVSLQKQRELPHVKTVLPRRRAASPRSSPGAWRMDGSGIPRPREARHVLEGASAQQLVQERSMTIMAGPTNGIQSREENSSRSWQDVWLRAVALSWQDEKFKSSLIEDVANALRAQFGYTVPAGISIKVKEVDRDRDLDAKIWDAAALCMTETLELPLPPKPENLRDEALALSNLAEMQSGARTFCF